MSEPSSLVSPRPCPVCARAFPGAQAWMTKRSLRLVRCSACAMVFVDPLPPESEASHYDQLGRPYYLSPDKLESDFASVRFERELALLRRFVSGGDVLDVGCSTGAFLHQLRTRWPTAYHGVGIDVSTAALDHARARGLSVISESLLTHDFASQQFDAVTFWAVLEHLPDPAAFVSRAAQSLRPGGFCLVLVPNLQSLAFRLLGSRYRYVLAQHVNYFDQHTLRSLLKQCSLSVVDLGFSHFNPVVIGQDWRRGNDEDVPDHQRASLLRRTTRWKQSRLAAPARAAIHGAEMLLALAGLADNLWMVARRT